MKILLTGANGFVGSHVLDTLRAHELPAAILLRPSANRRFIQSHLSYAEVRSGAITDPASLSQAMTGITHVIHCAGCTRAARISDFYEVNQGGTANVVQAANAQPGFRRLVHLSSLAACGPANPAREEDDPHPVSDYGKSKLAGELEVRRHCRQEFVIVRPPAVYGPRDGEFLRLFKAVKAHLLPRPSRQLLSLVFVEDLARAVVACLEHPAAAGKTGFAANPEVVTARAMAAEIAAQMGGWTLPLPLPTALLWPLCLAYEIASRLTGKPSVLSLQKFAELRAPAWVCDPGLLERETGCRCPTTLKAGIGRTLAWYRQERWV
ncbi:MAG: NAD-dependent epimerase/dehydratase family protein [Limisphaerales bacterium]